MTVSRRKFLTLAGATAAGATALSPLEAFYARVARGQAVRGAGYGALSPKLPTNTDELPQSLRNVPILELPDGFNYTAFSITGQMMADGNPVPGAHDGMAAFPGPNRTTILVRNHELSPTSGTQVVTAQKYDAAARGGTTTLVVGSNRRLIRDFASIGGTTRNCAGGPTPWGTWVTCEETFNTGSAGVIRHGYNFEVPATANIAIANPVPLREMGRFNREAIAVDPDTGFVYQTEDRGDSCFYRFRPNQYGNLRSGGVLEALVIQGAPQDTRRGYLGFKNVPLTATWVRIDNPDPVTDTVRVEARNKGAALFARGEGAWYGNGLVYFTCTSGGDIGRGQVFAYNPRNSTITLVVESIAQSELDSPDNITVAPFGDLILCEDGSGEQFVVGVNSRGELYQLARNNLNTSEWAGACFSPEGQTLFVNIQSPGITLAIWGPWSSRRA